MLAGPVAWALDLLVSYSRVKETCGSARIWFLYAIAAVALAVVAGGAWAAWLAFKRTPTDAGTDGDSPVSRSRFMGALGLATSAYFGIVVVAGALPPIMQSHACQ